jgi:glutathione peroxidase
LKTLTQKISRQRRSFLSVGAVGAVGALGIFSVTPSASAQTAACPALLQHTFKRLQDDVPQPLCQYVGKVLLIVNTASYCGFTPQYEGLEKLHSQYAAQGLVILGFPSNDFGQQEPGNAKQIAELCFNTYGVKFPMLAKTVVKGKDAHPLFVALAQATGKAPGWNFHKYLVGRNGKALASYVSDIAPTSAELKAAVEKALAQRV